MQFRLRDQSRCWLMAFCQAGHMPLEAVVPDLLDTLADIVMLHTGHCCCRISVESPGPVN